MAVVPTQATTASGWRPICSRSRQRAKEVYDWAAIIPQYEALWAQLTEIRTVQSKDL